MKIHENSEQYVCDRCGAIFNYISPFNRHIATHMGGFYCPVDGCQSKPFVNEYSLQRHLIQKHQTGITPLENLVFY